MSELKNEKEILAYLIGALADGSIFCDKTTGVYRVKYYPQSKVYLESCIESRIFFLFGKKGCYYCDKRNRVYFYEVTSKTVYQKIKNALGGFKAKFQRNVPCWIMNGCESI
ncbi:MAG: hypothetical protein ACTSQY_08675, partial [Candidatus Odinarchaeia archaeon]